MLALGMVLRCYICGLGETTMRFFALNQECRHQSALSAPLWRRPSIVATISTALMPEFQGWNLIIGRLNGASATRSTITILAASHFVDKMLRHGTLSLDFGIPREGNRNR